MVVYIFFFFNIFPLGHSTNTDPVFWQTLVVQNVISLALYGTWWATLSVLTQTAQHHLMSGSQLWIMVHLGTLVILVNKTASGIYSKATFWFTVFPLPKTFVSLWSVRSIYPNLMCLDNGIMSDKKFWQTATRLVLIQCQHALRNGAGKEGWWSGHYRLKEWLPNSAQNTHRYWSCLTSNSFIFLLAIKLLRVVCAFWLNFL